jgi:hypothetical protein
MKNCQWCNKEFSSKISYQIYCSVECRDLSTREKIAARNAINRRNRMINKKRKCKSCKASLSAYNDDQLCHSCLINPSEVSKALKELKDIANED